MSYSGPMPGTQARKGNVQIMCECRREDCRKSFHIDTEAALNMRINGWILVARDHVSDDDEIVAQHVAWVAVRPKATT